MSLDRRSGFTLCLVLLVLVLIAATSRTDSRAARAQGEMRVPILGHSVVRIYPHDPEAFTQGLVYLDGFLYESTGLPGRSTIRKVKLETGEVIQRHRLARQYFGEGLTHWESQLVQLTWQTNIGFVYDRATFKVRDTFTYTGEGWGLTQDGRRLVMSDGTAALRFLDPQTLEETGRLTVREGQRPVNYLNELEFVRGKLYANVWQTNRLAIIDPASGQLTAWVDLGGLLTPRDRENPVDVLNGIAYDSRGDRLFVTGKLWPKLFQIKVAGTPSASARPPSAMRTLLRD